MNLQKQNVLFGNIGRYLLAVLFLAESINCFINPLKLVNGSTHFYLSILFCSFWFISALSFIFRIRYCVMGVLVAGVASYNIAANELVGLQSSTTVVQSLLAIAFYLSMGGGALMVASKDVCFKDLAIGAGVARGMSIAGRMLIGAFFVIVGYLHFTNVDYDASLISGMPDAVFWVIFVGICWIATALSFWSNTITHISAILASILVLIISLSINIPALRSGCNMADIMAIANNIGLIGSTMMVASVSGYCLLAKLRSRN